MAVEQRRPSAGVHNYVVATTSPGRGVLRAHGLAAGLIATVAGASGISWILRLPFWAADLAVLGLPLVVLLLSSSRARAAIQPGFVGKYVVFGIVFFDYLGIRYNAWSGESSFPLLPGAVPVEHVVWCTLTIMFALTVNRHYFAISPTAAPQPANRMIVKGMLFGGIAFALVPPLHPLIQDYVYLKIGIVLYPIIFLLAVRTEPRLVRELLLTAGVFAVLNLVFELLAVRNGYWSFPGEYVGQVTIAGQTFPMEELVFTVLLLAPAIVATHALRTNWQSGRDRRCRRALLAARFARVRAYGELAKLRILELAVGIPLAWSLMGGEDAGAPRTFALLGLAAVIVLATSAAALAFDDIAGLRDGADLLNHRTRRHGVGKPLVQGTLCEREAATFARVMVSLAVAAAVTGLVVAPPSAWWLAVVGLAVIAAAINYSIGARLSYAGGHEVVTFAALAATVALPYVLVVSRLDARVLLESALVGLWMLQISLFSNTLDRRGDRAVGRRTVAVRMSERANRRVILAVFASGWTLCALGVALDQLPTWCLATLIPAAGAQLLQLAHGVRNRRWLRARAAGFWSFRLAVAALVATNLLA